MMNYEDKIRRAVKQLYTLCETLKTRYLESARREGSRYEPTWQLDPFDAAFAVDRFGLNGIKGRFGADDGEIDVMGSLDEISSLMIKDGTVYTYKSEIFGKRVIQDGFKVGTTSWVFMGRRNSPLTLARTNKNGIYQGQEVCVIQRRIPLDIFKILQPQQSEPIVWAGYFMNPYLCSELFGPYKTKKEILDAIEGNGRAVSATRVSIDN
jgi:hypothetical protein